MSKFSNGLSDGQLERFAILMEELGEAQQVIGKIIRHGLHSRHPNDPGTGLENQAMLEKELGDLHLSMDMMCASDLNGDRVHQHSQAKRKAIKKFLHHEQPV